MLCFLPPVPAFRPDPGPDKDGPQAARAAQAVILIFVILNVLFVLTGLLPLVARNEPRDRSRAPGRPPTCLELQKHASGAGRGLACGGPLP